MKYLKSIVFCLTLGLAMTTITPPVDAQCPMCKMSAESNLKNGGTAGKGLNKGILYMLMMPYLLVGTIGFIWYRNRKREDELEQPHETYSLN